MASPYAAGRSYLQQAGQRAKQGPANFTGTGYAGLQRAGAAPAAAPAQQPAQVADRPFSMSDQAYRQMRSGAPASPVVQASGGMGTVAPGRVASPAPGMAQRNPLIQRGPVPGASGAGMSVHPGQGYGAMALPTGGGAPSQDARGTYVRGDPQSFSMPQAPEPIRKIAGALVDQVTGQLAGGGSGNTTGGQTATERGGAPSPREQQAVQLWTRAPRASDLPQAAQAYLENEATPSAGGGGGGSGAGPAGGVYDTIRNLMRTLTEAAVQPAGDVADAFNNVTKGSLGNYYDDWSELSGMQNAANAMFDPEAQAAADAAQRQQMVEGIRDRRDEALRMQLGAANRGGRMGSSGLQGTYNAALAEQARGERELAQDQFERMLARNQLGGQLAGDAARTKYATMADSFTDPREIASMMMEIFGDLADKGATANNFAAGPLGWLMNMAG